MSLSVRVIVVLYGLFKMKVYKWQVLFNTYSFFMLNLGGFWILFIKDLHQKIKIWMCYACHSWRSITRYVTLEWLVGLQSCLWLWFIDWLPIERDRRHIIKYCCFFLSTTDLGGRNLVCVCVWYIHSFVPGQSA